MTAPTVVRSPRIPAAGSSFPISGHVPGRSRWMGLVGFVGAIALFLFESSLLVSLAHQLCGISLTGPTTPAAFLTNNVVLIVLIPLSMFLQWGALSARVGYLFSVQGRLRWGWLGRAMMVVGAVLTVILVAEMLVPTLLNGGDGTPQHRLAWLFIVVFTTPLQAAAEEIFFRGVIGRSLSALIGNERLSIAFGFVGSSIVFAYFHGSTDPWLIAYYFCFGLALSAIAWLTGGLEAGIVVHTVNNVVALLVASQLGSMDNAFDRSAGTGGPIMLLQISIIALMVPLAWWWGRRNHVATRIGNEPSPSDVAPQQRG